jgi:rhodanese-related sulfurtransferase
MVGGYMCFETISVKALTNYIGVPDSIIIDLREDSDYQKGHIPTAVNIPYDDLENNYSKLNKDLNIVLYCDRGSMSLLAAKELCKQGYHVINVYGGIHAYRGKLEV